MEPVLTLHDSAGQNNDGAAETMQSDLNNQRRKTIFLRPLKTFFKTQEVSNCPLWMYREVKKQ